MVQRIIACLGDSITLSGYSDIPYPQYLENSLKIAFPGNQDAVGLIGALGGTSGNALVMSGQSITGKEYTKVSVLIGVNDLLNGDTAATIMANIDTICNNLIADGKTVLLSTVLPFKNATGYTGAKQTQLDSLNALIRARLGVTLIEGHNGLRDNGGDPLQLNPAYNSGDSLHINAAGAQAFAALLFAAV